MKGVTKHRLFVHLKSLWRRNMKDAIVEEIREIRQQIEQEFDHETNKYLDHVYEAQKTHGSMLVRRRPNLLKRRKAM